MPGRSLGVPVPEIATVVPVELLQWITFGHVESDECASMNNFLAAAPNAQVAHGVVGCNVSLNEMADRPPRPMVDGEVLAWEANESGI